MLGFDKEYFTYTARNVPPALQLSMPNIHYVAATRATQLLIIAGESIPGGHLPYVRRGLLEAYSQQRPNPPITIHRSNQQVPPLTDKQIKEGLPLPPDTTDVSSKLTREVTRLVAHLPYSLLRACLSLLEVIEVAPAGPNIRIPMSGVCVCGENVADEILAFEDRLLM